MWEVRDAEEGKVHPSVRERERGEWVIEIRLGDVDASAGTCSSWTVESGVKRLADNCLSSVSKYRKRLGREFWQPASCI